MSDHASKRRSLFILTAALLSVTLGSAASIAEVPAAAPLEGGQRLLAAEWREQMLARNPTPGPFGGAKISTDGVELTTTKLAPNPHRVDVGVPTSDAITRGQVLLLRFAARSIKPADMTGQTQLLLYFQKTSPDWFKSMEQSILLTDAWQRFDVPFKVNKDYAAGEAGVFFAYGFAPQVAEIADVQLFAFPAGTDLSTLPHTQRLSGEIDPKHYAEVVSRIVAFRKELTGQIGVSADVVKTPGRVLHVSADTAPGGDGSTGKPFATIQVGVDAARAGDTVLVAAGTYDRGVDKQSHVRIKTSGEPQAWISIRAAPGARPKIVSSAWKAIELSGVHYVEIRGFEFVGVNSEANKNSGNGVAILDRSAHVRVIDNVVHGFGGGGIYSSAADYVHVEGNTVYDTSKGSEWGNSAISLYQCVNSDDVADRYKNVIRRNVCYDNENLRPFKSGGGSITDGNGIIMDDNRHTQNKSRDPAFKGWTLIENNLVYGNGGRGIHSYKSDHIDVINNTLYMNQGSKDIRNGELSASVSSEMNFFNNLVFARENLRANSSDRATDILYARNLYYNTDDYLDGREPIIGKNPMFLAPDEKATTSKSFRLKAGSAALGAAIGEVAPPDDLLGRPRGGAVDVGALQDAGK